MAAAAGTRLGTGYVEVEPDFSRFQEVLGKRLNQALAPAFRKAGSSSGKELAKGIDTPSFTQALKPLTRRFSKVGDEAGRSISKGIAKGSRSAGSELNSIAKAMQKNGIKLEKTAGSAAKAMRSLESDTFGVGRAAKKSGATLLSWHSKTEKAEAGASRFSGVLRGLGGDLASTARGLRVTSKGFGGFDGVMARTNRGAQFFRNIWRTIRWPAIIAGVGLTAQGLSALAAGAVAATSALGPLGGALIVLPAAAVAAAQAFSVLKLATAGVGDAVKAALAAEVEGGTQAIDTMRQQEDAAERVADAKRNLTGVQRQALTAQEDLTQARADARRELEDMRLASERSHDSEQGAVLSLKQAQQDLARTMADPKASGLDIRFAEEAVDQARHDLEQTRIDAERSRQDYRKAQKAGVEGMPQVVSAKQAEADANRAVTDAQRDLERASRDATAAMEEQGAAASALQDKMSQLPVPAQKFVRLLVSMKPRLDALRDAAAGGFFPGAERGLKGLMGNFKEVRGIVGKTAGVLGGIAAKAGKKLGSAVWGKDLSRLGKTNARILDRMGDAGLNLADALRHVLVAAEPFLDWLSESTLDLTGWMKEESAAGRRSGALAEFFDRTRDTMERLGPILKGVGGAMLNIGEAARPLGNQILDALGGAAEGWRKWTGSVQGQNELGRYFANAKPAIFEMGRLVRDLTKEFFKLGAQPGLGKLLRQVRTKLLPAVFDLVATLTGAFGEALVNALTNVVGLIGQLAHANGPLVLFVRTLGVFAGALTNVLKHNPALQTFASTIVGVLAVAKAASFIGAITGFTKLKNVMLATAAASRSLAAGETFSKVASEQGLVATSAGRLGQSTAGKMAGSFGRALGPALGALGLANIVMSATGGDWKKVGIEAGGALAGGLAGFMVGGPLGAIVGAGAGSLLGGALSGLFDSTRKLAPLQERLRNMSRHSAKALRDQAHAADALVGAQQRMKASHQREKAASEAVAVAQRRHTAAVKKFGPDSMPALKAALDLARAQRQEARAAEAAKKAHKLSGIELELFKNRTVRAYAAQVQLIPGLQKVTERLEKKWRTEKNNLPLQERLEKKVRDLSKAERTRDRLLEESVNRVGPKFARSLQSMTEAQSRWGMNFKGLIRLVPDFGVEVESVRRGFGRFGESARTETTRTMPELKSFYRDGSGAFKNLAEAIREAQQNILDNTGKSMKAVGGGKFPKITLAPLKGGGEQEKQEGGFIVPGKGSGDSFRTMLPIGSGILNREATSAFGFQKGGLTPVALEPGERVFMPREIKSMGAGTFEAMNRAVPRFQNGGLLGSEPQISGPMGSLRLIGQAAIRQVYEGAQSFMQKQKSAGGGGGVIADAGPLGRFNRSYPEHMLSNVGGKARFSESLVARIAAWAGLPGRLFGQVAHGESNFYPGVFGIDPGGTEGLGLWQITTGFNDARIRKHGGRKQMFNPLKNAKAAKEIYDEQGLGAWYGLDYVTGLMNGGLLQRLQGGGAVQDKKDGNPFNPLTMRGAPSSAPRRLAGETGFMPKTIGRIKAKADQIASAFTGYVWGGGHGEHPVMANGLDCSGAVAKLMQRSGWPEFESAHSSEYAHRFHSGPGDLFTIWSNDTHTLAEIDGQMWGTHGDSELGYHSHTTSGFAPSHPELAPEGGGGAGGAGAGAGGPSAPPKEKVPATFKGAKTGNLDFGPLPKTLDAVNKELAKWQKEIKVYGKAKREAEKIGKPETAEAIGRNISKIQDRLRGLEQMRSRLRLAKVREKLSKRLGKAFGRFGRFEQIIEGSQLGYEKASQFAEQVVDLEPQSPEIVQGKGESDKAFDARREQAERDHEAQYSTYIEGQERPAFGNVLSRVADWRNNILRAEIFGFGDGEHGFKEKQPSVSSSQGSWEGEIKGSRQRIAKINRFIEAVRERVETFRKKNPDTKVLPDWLKGQIEEREEMRKELPILRLKDTRLSEAVIKARELFFPGGKNRLDELPENTPVQIPLPGTGSLEEKLREVQGIQWPGYHNLLSAGQIGDVRQAGRFGGVIWDLQGTISELGLKIRQATNGIASGGGGGEEDREGENEGLLRELLTQKNQEALIRPIEERIIGGRSDYPPFGGVFHTGGTVTGGPIGAERTIVAQVGETVFTPDQMDALGEGYTGGAASGPPVIEELHLYSDGRARMRYEGREFETAVRKVTQHDDRRAARNASRRRR